MTPENAPARIGKTIAVCGELRGNEDLVLDGRVEGIVHLEENKLTIGPNADVSADLTAKDILIQGRVKGNIVASGRVEMRAGCVVEGDIKAVRLAIEDNATFRGRVELIQVTGKGMEVPAVSQTGMMFS